MPIILRRGGEVLSKDLTYKSIYRPDLFKGKRIVITGGGSGMGRCAAHELTSLGASVALVGRTKEKLLKVASEIREIYGVEASIHPVDIRNEAQVIGAVEDILSYGMPIDGLVNNAGGQFISPLEDISLNGWEAVIRNNLTSGFIMSKACFHASMRENGGSIVNIIADMWRSMPGMGHSGAARAGMMNLTETAALEWSRFGVRVNAVAPGWIASNGLTSYPEKERPRMNGLQSRVPLKRFGTESEMSAAILFLLSDAASFISGSCIRVDGAVPNTRVDWQVPDHNNSRPFHAFPLETQLDFLEPVVAG